jgi:hypothetical protein
MTMLSLVMLVAAAICSTIAGFWYPGAPPATPLRPHLGWIGISLYLWHIVFFGGGVR